MVDDWVAWVEDWVDAKGRYSYRDRQMPLDCTIQRQLDYSVIRTLIMATMFVFSSSTKLPVPIIPRSFNTYASLIPTSHPTVPIFCY